MGSLSVSHALRHLPAIEIPPGLSLASERGALMQGKCVGDANLSEQRGPSAHGGPLRLVATTGFEESPPDRPDAVERQVLRRGKTHRSRVVYCLLGLVEKR